MYLRFYSDLCFNRGSQHCSTLNSFIKVKFRSVSVFTVELDMKFAKIKIFLKQLKSNFAPWREVKQQRGRRLRKRHFKSEVALRQTFSRLFLLVQFVKYWHFFLDWILNVCIKVREKKKKVVVLRSGSPHSVKLGSFALYSCSDGKEKYKKAWCACVVIVLTI